jgi:hypothetical protein
MYVRMYVCMYVREVIFGSDVALAGLFRILTIVRSTPIFSLQRVWANWAWFMTELSKAQKSRQRRRAREQVRSCIIADLKQENQHKPVQFVSAGLLDASLQLGVPTVVQVVGGGHGGPPARPATMACSSSRIPFSAFSCHVGTTRAGFHPGGRRILVAEETFNLDVYVRAVGKEADLQQQIIIAFEVPSESALAPCHVQQLFVHLGASPREAAFALASLARMEVMWMTPSTCVLNIRKLRLDAISFEEDSEKELPNDCLTDVLNTMAAMSQIVTGGLPAHVIAKLVTDNGQHSDEQISEAISIWLQLSIHDQDESVGEL